MKFHQNRYYFIETSWIFALDDCQKPVQNVSSSLPFFRVDALKKLENGILFLHKWLENLEILKKSVGKERGLVGCLKSDRPLESKMPEISTQGEVAPFRASFARARVSAELRAHPYGGHAQPRRRERECLAQVAESVLALAVTIEFRRMTRSNREKYTMQ